MNYVANALIFFALFTSASALFNCTAGAAGPACTAGGCLDTGLVCTVDGCCPEASVIQDLVCDEFSKTGPCDPFGCTAGDACIGRGTAQESCCAPGGIAELVTTTTTTTTRATTTKRIIQDTCVDLLNPRTGVSDCPSRSYLCTDATYLPLMRVQCPRTCGFCNTGNALTSGCVDLLNPRTGISDCPARRSYCNNPNYKTLMKQQCCATCSSIGK